MKNVNFSSDIIYSSIYLTFDFFLIKPENHALKRTWKYKEGQEVALTTER